ncbi:MAG: DUF3696 domain-containing protein, partial [Ignavibacterium sp.]|nr:DUF3696 domain-containing protein [Ignavibacterium sp.]
KSELSKYVHLTSVREKPKQIYTLNEGRFLSNDYYGLLREYDKDDHKVGVLLFAEHFDFDNEIKLIENVQGVPVDSLSSFINHFLKKLELADSIELEKDSYSGFLKFKSFNSNTFSNLANASSGLLQILPIISTSFFVPNLDKVFSKYIRLIEQPELHLHPKLQAMLAEFFCHKALRDRTFIIETHSEHFIRKIQVLIAKSDQEKSHQDLKDRVGVYYFQKDKDTGQTSVKEMQMEDNGFFKEPWPDGFFDEASDLAYALLEAQINRKN